MSSAHRSRRSHDGATCRPTFACSQRSNVTWWRHLQAKYRLLRGQMLYDTATFRPVTPSSGQRLPLASGVSLWTLAPSFGRWPHLAVSGPTIWQWLPLEVSGVTSREMVDVVCRFSASNYQSVFSWFQEFQTKNPPIIGIVKKKWGLGEDSSKWWWKNSALSESDELLWFTSFHLHIDELLATSSVSWYRNLCTKVRISLPTSREISKFETETDFKVGEVERGV